MLLLQDRGIMLVLLLLLESGLATQKAGCWLGCGQGPLRGHGPGPNSGVGERLGKERQAE